MRRRGRGTGTGPYLVRRRVLPGLSREARSTDRAGLSLLSFERFTGWSGFDSLVFLRVKWRVIPGVCWEPHRHPAFWEKSAV